MAKTPIHPKEVTEELISKSLQHIPEQVTRIINKRNQPVGEKINQLMEILDVVTRLRAALVLPVPGVDVEATAAYAGNKPGSSRAA